MNKSIKKIAIVGPESTGKSTISAQLAVQYHTIWVPEFARGYCEKLTEPCTWQDEVNMFHGQLELEEKLISTTNNDLLICDTTFLTVKIWCDYTFGRPPQEVVDELLVHHYDFYLLMDIDLPWEEDPLREFSQLREYFMQIWHTELTAIGANYKVISGTHSTRFQNAINAIDNFLGIQ